MSQTAPNRVGWAASSSEDVVGYRLRVTEAPLIPDYADTAIEVGNVTEFDFGASPDFAGLDGVYNLALSAVDDAGNESDLTRLSSYPLDLVPPAAPTEFRKL